MSGEVRDVIIIGSGPAGLTAAIYTARANLSPLLLEGEPSSTSDQPGGQLMLTTEVENFPGFPAGIMGPELMGGFREQALRFGTEIQTVKASRVELTAGPPFGVWVGDPQAPEPTYRARSIIVSTGARSLMLGLPAEERKFSPHITLARLKDAPADRIGRFLSDRGLFRAGPMPVDHVTLYRSHLGNGGAVYEALRDYPLES